MPYKITKTVPSIAELIPECTPCCGIGECIGPACKLYQVSKFLDISCASLFYSYTNRVIEFFKGDIDIEEIEEFKDNQESENPQKSTEEILKCDINYNLSPLDDNNYNLSPLDI